MMVRFNIIQIFLLIFGSIVLISNGQYIYSTKRTLLIDNYGIDSITIQGRLLSFKDSMPITGASILLGDNIGFISDSNGLFKIKLPGALVDSIIIQYIGRRTITISNLPKNQEFIDLNTILLFESKEHDIIDGYLISSWWRIIHNIKARKFFKKQSIENQKNREIVNKTMEDYRYYFDNKIYKIDIERDRINLSTPERFNK